MTGSSVSVERPCTADPPWTPRHSRPRCHRVRALICAYQPVRDREGRIISVSSLALNNPQDAARIIAPLDNGLDVSCAGVSHQHPSHVIPR
jgi:hypothetical protein